MLKVESSPAVVNPWSMVFLKIPSWGLYYYLSRTSMICCALIVGMILSYVDDTVLLFEENPWETFVHLVNEDLQKMNDWFKTNNLIMNLSKTNYVPFIKKIIYLHMTIFY